MYGKSKGKSKLTAKQKTLPKFLQKKIKKSKSLKNYQQAVVEIFAIEKDLNHRKS